MGRKFKKSRVIIISGVTVTLITTLGIVSTLKIRKGERNLLANESQTQAILEKENSGTEIAVQSEENSGIAVQDSSVATQAVDTSSWDLTKVDIVYDTANVPVPVPKGYVASGANGEHTVNTGFVIYEGTTAVTTSNAWNESCTRNQWVWVPVPDVSRIYEVDENGKKKGKLYEYSSTGRTTYTSGYEPGIVSDYDNEKYFAENYLQGMAREKFLHEMQEEFDFTIESIIKYGGFYIGRYGTGNIKTKTPVVQRINTDHVWTDWYAGYSRLQRLGANENVKSNMIWGCLWDETLQWLVDSGNKTYAKIKDSRSWGNCYASTFTYKTNTSGSTATKSAESSKLIPTGSTEYSKANNIYDMAGNTWNWTLELRGTKTHVLRGSCYSNPGSQCDASRRSHDYPTVGYDNNGFRAYLYIK